MDSKGYYCVPENNDGFVSVQFTTFFPSAKSMRNERVLGGFERNSILLAITLVVF